MEGLFKGSESVAIDEVEEAETRRDQRVATVEGGKRGEVPIDVAQVLFTCSIQCHSGVI
jgi:hypothetical protein